MCVNIISNIVQRARYIMRRMDKKEGVLKNLKPHSGVSLIRVRKISLH